VLFQCVLEFMSIKQDVCHHVMTECDIRLQYARFSVVRKRLIKLAGGNQGSREKIFGISR